MAKDENILLETEGRTAGELLKLAREQKGMSIEDVQDALKIQAKHIEAIEYDDHDELPGRVYAIGFIRTYAEYMEFDPDKMVELFKMTAVGRHAAVDLSSHGEVVTISQVPSTVLVVLCVVGLCFVGITFGQKISHDSVDLVDTAGLVPEPPEHLVENLEKKITIAYNEVESSIVEPVVEQLDLQDIEMEQEVQEAPVLPKPVPEAIVGQSNDIVIKAIYDSWIEVRDGSGKAVYSGILQMGNRYTVPEGEGYRLMTGNAGGTEVFIAGKSKGILGKVSQVRKNIKLDVLSNR